ncbi:MAG: hypothetical protein MO853_10965 [Candidatus Protistobacter heckmanni]|nr:hypothetical protein [Candidatus Protistobacter heckmanni]
MVGGEARVRELVARFYELMDLEPDFTKLRALHGPTQDNACHLPFRIDSEARDQLVICIGRAMMDTGLPEHLQERLLQSFFLTADWMRNTPDVGKPA